MNFLVLLVSFVFAATVHAESDLPKVLVIKNKGKFHPLSRPIQASTSSALAIPLVWGHPLGVPVEYILTDTKLLLSTNLSPPGYVNLGINKPFVLQRSLNAVRRTHFLGQQLVGTLFVSCPYSENILGSSSSLLYHTVLPQEGDFGQDCDDVKVYLLPFDRETRKVLFINNAGETEKTVTSLSVPEDSPPLALFIQIRNIWYPLTVDYMGPNQDSYSLLYDIELQYPLDFKIDSQKKQLVSVNEKIPGFACFEQQQSSVAIFKSPCSKPITLGEENKVLEKKVFVCGNDKKLYHQESKDCEAVDVHLFHYERASNLPLLDMPVIGLDHAPAPVTVPESGSESGAKTGKGGEAEGEARSAPEQKPANESTQQKEVQSGSPTKFPWVFLLKDEGSLIPLSSRLFKDYVSEFYYDKSKGFPEFEYVNGIATTEYAPTPGSVMFEENNLLFGRTDHPTMFNIDKNGIVDHEFYLCGLKLDYERLLFTSHPGQTYLNCKKETIYFMPYDKATESVAEGWEKVLSHDETESKGVQEPEIPPVLESTLVTSTGIPGNGHNSDDVLKNKTITPVFNISGLLNDSQIPQNGLEKKVESKGTNSTAKENKNRSIRDASNNSNGGSPVSNSKSKQLENSNGSVPGFASIPNPSMKGTNECNTTHCEEGVDTLDTLNGTHTSAGVIPNDTICNECRSESQTTVWKTYTDYTTYCPESTTVTITVCEKVCVPSTMTVPAAATLTVTGKCIVPETTTIRLTRNGQKESLDKEKGSSTGQAKSELKPGIVKGADKSGSGNSGKSGKSGNEEKDRASQKTDSNSIPKPPVAPYFNSASKNTLGACILVFFALLL